MERLLLQAAVETMSLSNIIKKESLKNWSVCDVDYEALTGNEMRDADPSHFYPDSDGFAPLFFNEHLVMESDSSKQEVNETEGVNPEDSISSAADIPEGTIFIAEDELQRQLADAFERGAEEGRQVAERGLAHAFKSLRDGADSLALLREKILRESESDLLKLSSMVARKIILQQIQLDPHILANIVAATVNCCSEQDKITIRLSTADYQMVMANRHILAGVAGDEGRFTLVPDNSITLGGCLVESPSGTVDARIESQLDEVYNRCMEERGIPQESLIGAVEGEEGR
jgi:flagellar assembly protein FliH